MSRENILPLPLKKGLFFAKLAELLGLHAASSDSLSSYVALDSLICTNQPTGLYVSITLDCARSRYPPLGERAPEDHRYRAGLIHKSGCLCGSPVIIEIPVRADKRHGNLKEGAAPNHGEGIFIQVEFRATAPS